MLDCQVCTSTASMVKRLAKNVIGRAIAVRIIMNVCTRYNLATKDTCAKIIDAHKEHFLYVLQRTTLTGREICERLDYCEGPEHDDDIYDSPDTGSAPHFIIKNNHKLKLRIAHLTDVHLDLDYRVGSEAECDDVICCHAVIKSGNVTRPAGPFGDFKCDTPAGTVKSFREHVRDQKVDLIAFTGDMAAHDVWSESKAKAMLTEGALARLLYDGNTIGSALVVPVVGNHESVPANSFPYGNLTGLYSSRWLYSSLALQWLPFLSLVEREQFIRHGRYKHVIPDKKVMIIAMNTNMAYLFNVWRLLYYPDRDPDGHLHWLREALQSCRQDHLQAVILGHHPPGEPDLSRPWTRQFNHIITHFSDDIMVMLFGHTHLDTFRLFRRARQVALVGPSMATWTDTQPAYRVLSIDHELVSQETFLMDLQSGKWSLEYKFACSGEGLYRCYGRYYDDINGDDKVKRTFITRHFKSSPWRISNCTEKCQNDIVQSLVFES